ncbi:MAG: DUF1638 domain-containing protein [Alphaproteobacteria bacterium]|jgi:hypothetical protein|nr:DUF1638 domain-containing protein [Alphaproteobacteria bacterium]
MDDKTMDGLPPVDRDPLTQPPTRSGGSERPTTLFIACGALAKEIVALKEATGWSELTIACLPAHWHNTPMKIAPAVLSKIRGMGRRFDRVYVLYGDCGTGGELDRILEEEGVERIPGPHCYHFFMGGEEFEHTHDEDPTCFYLTDYLVRHFDRIIIKGLGLDRFPQLLSDYFGNYTRLIYVAQTEDPRLRAKGQAAAERLGLEFEYRFRGYGELGDYINAAATKLAPTDW